MNYVARKRCTCLSSTTIFANRIVPGQVHLPRYPRPYAPACRPLTSTAVKDGGRGRSFVAPTGPVTDSGFPRFGADEGGAMKPDADPRISRRTILTYGPVLGAAAAVAPPITGCAPRATSGETQPSPPTPPDTGKPTEVLPEPKPIPGGSTLPDGSVIHVFAPGTPGVTLPFTKVLLEGLDGARFGLPATRLPRWRPTIRPILGRPTPRQRAPRQPGHPERDPARPGRPRDRRLPVRRAPRRAGHT